MKALKNFEDLPLFGGDLVPFGGKSSRQKKRKQKKVGKPRRRSMKYVTDLPLFQWHIEPDFEGEVADTFRNIIKQYFYMKWVNGSDWNEQELIAFVRSSWDLVPIVTFIEFWTNARKSPKGKLAWIDHLDKINEEDWQDYTKLVRTKLMNRDGIKSRKNER